MKWDKYNKNKTGKMQITLTRPMRAFLEYRKKVLGKSFNSSLREAIFLLEEKEKLLSVAQIKPGKPKNRTL